MDWFAVNRWELSDLMAKTDKTTGIAPFLGCIGVFYLFFDLSFCTMLKAACSQEEVTSGGFDRGLPLTVL